jgi:hypothetical protein
MIAAIEAPIHTNPSAIRNWRIGFILASLFFGAFAFAQDPPADLTRRVIARETETQEFENNYTYRQAVTIEEFDPHGRISGQYGEVRDIIFSPQHDRTEVVLGKPHSTLTRLQLTDEDFRDIRDIQPFLLTRDRAALYETRFRGDETMDGIDCWVLQLRPRQILDGQRLFDGMIWVDKRDFSTIRSEGQAVPQIRTLKSENLFPHFTTLREKREGYWFPTQTYGDDTLYFRGGAQRMKLVIRYSNYQRFGSETKITFDK